MKKNLKFLIVVGVAFNVHATTGINDYGYGVVSKGMGGTGVAQAQNAFSMAINPANLVFLDRSSSELGLVIFTPRRYYSTNYLPQGLPPDNYAFAIAPGSYQSGSKWFGVPNFAYNKKITEKISSGISFYANGGMNTNFNSGAITGSGYNADPLSNKGIFGYGNTGGELRQMFLNIPLSIQLTPNFSIGASFLTLIETIKVIGLTAFAQPAFSVDPNNFTDRFTYTTFGVGGLLGAMAQINESISLGASYQPRITPGKLKSYEGTFPNGRIEVPEKIIVGTSIHLNSNLLVNVDYQFINYEQTHAFGNINSCVSGPFPCFGTSIGTGFGFKNTNAIKIGGQWHYNDLYILRAGYAYNNNPIQPSQVLLNVIAPAVTQNHITVGLTRFIGDDHQVNLSVLYSPTSSVEGPNAFNSLQTVKLSMHQYEFGVSWTWFLDNKTVAGTTK